MGKNYGTQNEALTFREMDWREEGKKEPLPLMAEMQTFNVA